MLTLGLSSCCSPMEILYNLKESLFFWWWCYRNLFINCFSSLLLAAVSLRLPVPQTPSTLIGWFPGALLHAELWADICVLGLTLFNLSEASSTVNWGRKCRFMFNQHVSQEQLNQTNHRFSRPCKRKYVSVSRGSHYCKLQFVTHSSDFVIVRL